jgi:hypothetical protein
MTKSRRMGWAGNVARMGEMRKAYRIFDGKPEEKIPLRRPKRIGEDDTKMEIGCEGVDWIHLARDRGQWRAVVKSVMNLWIP